MTDGNIRTQFITGIAVVVPMAVTLWVLLTLSNFVGSLLAPISNVITSYGVQSSTTVIIIQTISVGVIALLILFIGTITQHRIGEQIISQIDSRLASIPGLGSVYQTTRKMSDLLLDPDGDGTQFREVKMVEFPARNTYTLAFLTSSSPPDDIIAASQSIMGDETASFQTVFLPMAPNPVMGGHLTHVPEENIHSVDITVEQAIQYILTTGIVDASDSK